MLTIVEERKSLKLQIEGLEEKMREMTSNNETQKDNYMKEMERRLQEREDSLKFIVNEMKGVVYNTERCWEEKEKECVILRD